MLPHSNTGPSLLHMVLHIRAVTILRTIQSQDKTHLSQTTDTLISATLVFGILTVAWARVSTAGFVQYAEQTFLWQ